MAPPKKKPKLNKHHQYYDLTESADQFKDAVQKLPLLLERFPESLLLWKPLFTSIVEAFECTETADLSTKVYQASTLSTFQTVRYLGIDYEDDDKYSWALEATLPEREPMSPWACK
jgi:hypothetical protein